MNTKKRALILGSGFSRAVHEDMPTVQALAEYFLQRAQSDDEDDELLRKLFTSPYKEFLDQPENFELLLTYLSQEHPWKSPIEKHVDRALYEAIASEIGRYLARRESSIMNHPEWLKKLVLYLHNQHHEALRTEPCSSIPVITFNYDTVIERALLVDLQNDKKSLHYAGRLYNHPEMRVTAIDQSIYRTHLLYLTVAGSVDAKSHFTLRDLFGKEEEPTFHLLKLHGSINWFYSGQLGPSEIFCTFITDEKPSDTYYHSLRAARGKIPLIIPPILDKTPFYGHPFIRSLWTQAREYLQDADEIFCVGYSMPLTDLTTRQLFQSLSKFPGKTVYIVNLADSRVKAHELKRRYKMAFPKQKIDERFLLPQACRPVERMVEFLTGG